MNMGREAFTSMIMSVHSMNMLVGGKSGDGEEPCH